MPTHGEIQQLVTVKAVGRDRVGKLAKRWSPNLSAAGPVTGEKVITPE
jgi:hypothetical protein